MAATAHRTIRIPDGVWTAAQAAAEAAGRTVTSLVIAGLQAQINRNDLDPLRALAGNEHMAARLAILGSEILNDYDRLSGGRGTEPERAAFQATVDAYEIMATGAIRGAEQYSADEFGLEPMADRVARIRAEVAEHTNPDPGPVRYTVTSAMVLEDTAITATTDEDAIAAAAEWARQQAADTVAWLTRKTRYSTRSWSVDATGNVLQR